MFNTPYLLAVKKLFIGHWPLQSSTDVLNFHFIINATHTIWTIKKDYQMRSVPTSQNVLVSFPLFSHLHSIRLNWISLLLSMSALCPICHLLDLQLFWTASENQLAKLRRCVSWVHYFLAELDHSQTTYL